VEGNLELEPPRVVNELLQLPDLVDLGVNLVLDNDLGRQPGELEEVGSIKATNSQVIQVEAGSSNLVDVVPADLARSRVGSSKVELVRRIAEDGRT
jgi:hypothetical protein